MTTRREFYWRYAGALLLLITLLMVWAGPKNAMAAQSPSGDWFGAGKLTLYANHNGAAQCLSAVMEDGNGGVIVIDGGWQGDSDFLLDQIKQKGGHVSAWLLTHPHSDHVGALIGILNNHANEITIDNIYYSFLDDAWYQEKDQEAWNNVYGLRQAFSKLSQEKLHGDIYAGQRINLGNITVQVLNSAYKLNSDFVNNSSVAYLVEMNGTKVVFLGDLGHSGGEQLMKDVDLASLGCDIVQMAHHGQNGVGYEVYKALRPKVCIWPTPQWLWDNDNGGGYNSGNWTTLETRQWLVRLGVKESYCIKDGDQVIE